MLPADSRFKEDTLEALEPLNVKQRDFVLAYATVGSPTRGNGKRSAEAAGYALKSCEVRGSVLLGYRKVKLAVMLVERDTRKALEAVTLVDEAWLHRHLSMLATSSILDYGRVTADGGFEIDFNMIAERPELAAAIESVDIRRSADPIFPDEIRIKLLSRSKLIELVGKHVRVQAWKDNLEVTDHRDVAARIHRARELERGKRST